MSMMGTDEIFKREVVSSDGRKLGELASLHLEWPRGRVVALGIKVRREVLEELKLPKPLWGSKLLWVPIAELSGVGDSIVLRSALAATPLAATPLAATPAAPAEGEQKEAKAPTKSGEIKS